MKILLIDDERDVVDNLKVILDSHGHHCVVAYDGEQGINLFQSEKPDVIVTDFNMPKFTGFQLAQHVRKAGSSIPIILITAYHTHGERAPKFGITKSMVKPFEIDDLVAEIGNYAGAS